jgi:hypothetical protein
MPTGAGRRQPCQVSEGSPPPVDDHRMPVVYRTPAGVLPTRAPNAEPRSEAVGGYQWAEQQGDGC